MYIFYGELFGSSYNLNYNETFIIKYKLNDFFTYAAYEKWDVKLLC